MVRCILLAMASVMVNTAWALMLDIIEVNPHARLHKKFRQELANLDGSGMEFTALMSIGGQAVQGILDTGSYELLVFSADCTTCGTAVELYDRSRSSSHEAGHMRVSHTFGSGTTKSRLAYEDVDIGPMHAARQYFWEVFSADIPTTSLTGFRAIVGVGPPSTPRRDSQAQAERLEVKRKQLEANQRMKFTAATKAQYHDVLDLAEEPTLLESFEVAIFSVCIGRPAASPGYFIWNDDDPLTAPPGAFRSVPSLGTLTWSVRMSDVSMQAESAGSGKRAVTIGCQEGCGALLDSGTSLLVMPSEAAQEALHALSTLHADCSNLATLPDLTFNFGEHKFSLPPQAYIGRFSGRLPEMLQGYVRTASDGAVRACELLIMTTDIQTQIGPMWILGLPFFREYYTTFSLGAQPWSLSFAEADDQCEPRKPGSGRAASLAQKEMRQVDLGSVRVPHWVEAAAKVGSTML